MLSWLALGSRYDNLGAGDDCEQRRSAWFSAAHAATMTMYARPNRIVARKACIGTHSFVIPPPRIGCIPWPGASECDMPGHAHAIVSRRRAVAHWRARPGPAVSSEPLTDNPAVAVKLDDRYIYDKIVSALRHRCAQAL